MKSRDGLLVLIVIGVVGALSFVAYRYGLDGSGAPEKDAAAGRIAVEKSAAPTFPLPSAPKDTARDKKLAPSDLAPSPAIKAARAPDPAPSSPKKAPTAPEGPADAAPAAVETAPKHTGSDKLAALKKAGATDASKTPPTPPSGPLKSPAGLPATRTAATDAPASKPPVPPTRAPAAGPAEGVAAAVETAPKSPSRLKEARVPSAPTLATTKDDSPSDAAPAAIESPGPKDAATDADGAAKVASADKTRADKTAVDKGADKSASAPRIAPSAAVKAIAPPSISSDPSLTRAPEASSAPKVASAPKVDSPAAARPSVTKPPASPRTLAEATAPKAAEPPSVAKAVAKKTETAAPKPLKSPGAAPSDPPALDPNDPASYPEEPGRAFITLGTEPPKDVTPPKIKRPALGAPLLDGKENPKAGLRDADPGDAKKGVLPTPDDPVARAAREGDKSFETPVTPVPPKPAKSSKDDVKPPEFDLVRVKPDGSGIIAGRAEPGALVTVLVDGTPSEVVEADSTGAFVVLLDPPKTPPVSIRFDLEAKTKKGVSRSIEPHIVTFSDKPGKPPVVIKPTPEGVKIVGPKSAEAAKDGRVSIKSIAYGAKGEVTIAGSGKPGDLARVYLDNGLKAEARVSPDGGWRVRLSRKLPPSVYTLRVDQTSAAGIVTSRAETPFERAPTNLVLRKGTVVVQPGNNLWKIADYVYGEGARYTVIYEGNRDQIRDPNLIYPGQVLTLPGSDPSIAVEPATKEKSAEAAKPAKAE
ncbi:MAG: LysM peptidoglycan-binding domain-containing protein [Neomegalonema sp.]|nr:LysM peptidoglycan-binding domain-containing protein [Neomegalonema sp.]